jgi:uncharacterized 2Fe-2S/4Fe-4S cluster protein (DUF4445 family)
MASDKYFRVRFEPEGREVEVPEGVTLTRAATLAGLPPELPCGGLGLCGKCRVAILDGLRPPTSEEEDAFTAEELEAGLRLACQQTVDRPMTVTLGEETRSRDNQIMVGALLRRTQVDSGVEQVALTLPKPPLKDTRHDWRRVEEAVGRPLQPSLDVLRDLPGLLKEGDSDLTVTTLDGYASRVAAGLSSGAPLGFAVDIGTTTLVCYVLDLATGAELAHAAMLNPQVQYGDDVIARIHHCGVFPEGLDQLSELVRGALDELLEQACADIGADAAAMARGTVVGNATMTHLFLGINPKGLGLAPFAPIIVDSVTACGAHLGLRAAPHAVVTVLPNMAGFLGSDTVGMILAAAPAPDATTLAVDIGTNGEMMLFHDGHWYGCSAAAGPAFEGARISCGLRGAAGAISRVELQGGDLHHSVISHAKPRGLCGSGLLDIIAVLRESGVLESTGRLLGGSSCPPALNARLSGEGAGRAFELVSGDESASGQPITLTARDIREVQLAKGSIRASIEALMARAGVGADDIAQVYLAGGFGSYLRVDSALRIGLLPPVPQERITAVGNAAGAGARLALVSRREMALAERLAREVEVLDLAKDAVYQMQLVEQMIFPD